MLRRIILILFYFSFINAQIALPTFQAVQKPNTAIAQAFYNKEEGTKKITTETGAGQWGS